MSREPSTVTAHRMPLITIPALSRAAAFALILPLVACAPGRRDTAGAAPRPAVVDTEPIEPDRPDFTDGPGIVPPGMRQLEGGTRLSHEGPVREIALGEALVRIGVTQRAELQLAPNSRVWRRAPDVSTSGQEDPDVGAKILLRPAGDRPRSLLPAVAVALGTSLPLGDDGIGSGAAEPRATLIGGWTFGERLGLSANLGWSLPHEERQRVTELAASASLEASLTRHLSGYVEWYGVDPQRRGFERTRIVDTGLSWLATRDASIDIHVGRRLATPSPNWFVGLGAAVRH